MPSPHFAPWWEAPPTILPDRAGDNRFVWNLRYTPPQPLARGWSGPPRLHGTPRGPQSPLVLPGTYRLVLTAAGRRVSTSLLVRPDPRVPVPAAALAERVRIGLELRGAIDASTRLVHRVRRAIAAAHKGGESQRAVQLTGLLQQQHLARLNARLIGLLGTINRADTPIPTAFLAAARSLQGEVAAARRIFADLLVPGL